MAVSNESPHIHAEPEPDLRELVITRIFEAPRELVFRAWTEDEHLKQWFAPRGFTIPICRLNLIPGGTFLYCMRATNGAETWAKWSFLEIVPPKRIMLVNTFSNKYGNPARHPNVADWPLEILTTTTLIEVDGRTGVKIAWMPVNVSKAERKAFEGAHDAMIQAWNGTLDQLAEYLATL
jgi:uncharacterized protein YndB with AHSA1/START domain